MVKKYFQGREALVNKVRAKIWSSWLFLPAIFPASLLLACSHTQTHVKPEFFVTAGANPQYPVAEALVSTRDAFLGDDNLVLFKPGAQTAPHRSRPQPQAVVDVFSNGTIPADLQVDMQVGLQARQTLLSSGPFRVEGRLTGSAGLIGYDLPKGLGIFIDPAEARFRTAALTPELRLSVSQNIGETPVTGHVGIGQVNTRTWTSINSALLDVDHTSDSQSSYRTVGITVGLPWSNSDFEVEGRLDPARRWQIRSLVNIPLGGAD